MDKHQPLKLNRRDLFKVGGGLLLGSAAALRPSGAPAQFGCDVGSEPFPTTPFVLHPFTDPLPVPAPLAPCSPADLGGPAPDRFYQDCDHGMHQVMPSDLGLPDPVYYKIKLQVAPHSFTICLILETLKMGMMPATIGTSIPMACALSRQR